MIAKHPFQITLSLNKNVVNFSLPPPLFHCHLQGRETFFDKANKILLALRFRSKLKQDVNISPFVNHFMLKNPRALDTVDTFLHAIYLRQNSKFSQLLFAAMFL